MKHIIIYLQNIKKNIIINENTYKSNNINTIIANYLNINNDDFFLINKKNNKLVSITDNKYNTNNEKIIILDIHFRERGGFIMGMISKFFETIFYPLVYPFKGIMYAFLMLIKMVTYMVALFIYFIKVMVWFFADFLPSIPSDIILILS